MASNFPDPTANNPDTGAIWTTGDTWTDPISGVSYVYDPDGTTPIWKTSHSTAEFDARYVEIAGDTMTGNLTVPSLNDGPLAGFRNVLINGGGAVWQRYTSPITPPSGGLDSFGVTITSSSLYGCDRWSSRNPNNSGGNVAHLKINASKGNGLRLDVAGSTSYQFIQQEIERANITHLSNQEVTLSLVCDRSTVRARVRTYDFTGNLTEVLENTVAPTDLGDNRYSWTFTLPVIGSGTLTAGNELNNDRGMQIVLYPDGLNTINGTTDFKEVQLEPGPVATPFEHRPIGTELALCQRYFCSVPADLQVFGYGDTTDGVRYSYPFPVIMRATPTRDKNPAFTGTNIGSSSVVPRNASHMDIVATAISTGIVVASSTESALLNAEL